MECIGKHFGRTVFYLDTASETTSTWAQLDNWICFAIASEGYSKVESEAFIRRALLGGMLEFRAQGSYGDALHLLCDWTMVSLEIDEGHSKFDVGLQARLIRTWPRRFGSASMRLRYLSEPTTKM